MFGDATSASGLDRCANCYVGTAVLVRRPLKWTRRRHRDGLGVRTGKSGLVPSATPDFRDSV